MYEETNSSLGDEIFLKVMESSHDLLRNLSHGTKKST